MFFTLIFEDNFFITDLVNCVCQESCGEKIAPISPNGSIIQDAAVNPGHRILPLSEIFIQTSNKLR